MQKCKSQYLRDQAKCQWSVSKALRSAITVSCNKDNEAVMEYILNQEDIELMKQASLIV